MLTGTFDGYVVGDRLLEGVLFRVEVDEIALKVVSVTPKTRSDDTYLDDLNKTKWLKEVENFINEELNNSFDAQAQAEPYYVDEFIDFAADFGLEI